MELVLTSLDRVRCVVVHRCSVIAVCCEVALPQYDEVENMAETEFVFFCTIRGRHSKLVQLKFGT